MSKKQRGERIFRETLHKTLYIYDLYNKDDF